MTCEHKNFACHCTVNRLDDIGRFTADLRIECIECNVPFRFLGLPLGLDINSATTSYDGTECRLAIAPKGETVPPVSGVEGFSIRKVTP